MLHRLFVWLAHLVRSTPRAEAHVDVYCCQPSPTPTATKPAPPALAALRPAALNATSRLDVQRIALQQQRPPAKAKPGGTGRPEIRA